MRVLHNGFATNFGLVGKNMRRYMATTALTATGLIAIASPAIANNWTDHVASEGSISIDTSIVNTTNITQHTNFVKVHGNGDINAGWTVNLAQPSSSSKYVLYDVKDDPTRILGTLNANGQVYIFDKNGVIFGEGSQVNVGSIITSTGFISDANIKANNLVFENVGGLDAGEIVNAGTITVADAGLAAFVAPTVRNSGKIAAKAGKVVLASGETVTLDLYGDNLVEIAADGALANALIDNSGTIEAAGGTVVLSAQAAKDAVDSVINMNGVVDVSSVTVKGGKIVLSGGNKGVVKVAGSLKADGQTGGGDVKVTGQNIHMTETSTVAASALTTGNGGVVDIIAQNALIYSGSIRSNGGVFGGNGGAVDTSGLGWVDIYGTVDAAAYNGTNGTWLIDPANLDIVSILAGNVTGSNPFSPTGGALTSSRLRNTVVNAALTGGTNVIITTVGSSDKILQDGTITVKADITSAGSGTLTLQAAGGIIVEAGRTIAASVGNTLNVVMEAVKDITLHGATINTRGGSVNFKAGDDITLTGLTQINTSGGNAMLNSTAGSFYVANGSAVNTAGGNIDVRAQGPVTTLLGLPVNGNIKVQGVLNAGGGKIDLKQAGLFIGDANSLRTSGTGTISLQQNSFEWLGLQLASIQNAIDAINNSGTGANTVTVTAGTFKESLKADVNNLVLKGAKAGIAGNHASRGTGETIINPNSPGVLVTADNVTIDGLTFAGATGADGYGIQVDGAANTVIKNNVVYNTSQHGIFAEDANGLNIERNKVTDTGGDGIRVINSTGSVRITNSLVGEVGSDIDGNGIHVENTHNAVVQRNILRNVQGDSAIYIKNSDYVTVGVYNLSDDRATNYIVNPLNNGITVEGGTGTDLYFNTVDGAGRYGIEAINTTDLNIFGSWVRNGTDKTQIAIYAHGGGDLDVVNNRITNVIEGIVLENMGGERNAIYGSRIAITSAHGVRTESVSNLLIEKNRISGVGGKGIHVTGSNFAKILRNEIWQIADDGIYVYGGNKVSILNNKVTDVGEDGIEAVGVRKVIVKENEVTNAGEDGITLQGFGFGMWPDLGGDDEEGGEEEIASARIMTPMVIDEGYEGPYVEYQPWKAIVKGNKVSNSGKKDVGDGEDVGDGIEVSGYDTIIVTEGNVVSNSAANGLFISGPNNGYVVVSGNIFNNNPIGAHFQSGLIDLTGEGNIFNAGETGNIGLRFAPYPFDYYSEYGYGPAFAKLDMSLLEMYLYPYGYAPLKLVDDGLSYPNVPGTFDGTIGSQIFTGYTELGKFYVELDNGAFFDPGRPTLLNGLNSTYDGLLPATTDGLLTQAQFDYLEARFQHYPDTNDLGLFWFGFVPSPAGFGGDQKDLFNFFESFTGGTSGLNVRIVGLPRLPGQGGGPGGTTPQNLNNIETFGGNPAALNEIETSAGGEPEDLANIETEAGGGNANCWSDAVGIAGSGQAVNVVYGGTLDDNLNQAADCGTSF